MTVALVAGLGAVTSVPLQVEKPPVVGIIDYVNQVKEDGSYSYRLCTHKILTLFPTHKYKERERNLAG